MSDLLKSLQEHRKASLELIRSNIRDSKLYKKIISDIEQALTKGYSGISRSPDLFEGIEGQHVLKALKEDGLIIEYKKSELFSALTLCIQITVPDDGSLLEEDTLQSENKRLRKALEEIASASIVETLGNLGSKMRKIAQDALKGGDNNDRTTT